ncbi:MAG TPA: hypothetical protein VEO54_29255 [Thermoanaerobaculia bacterium]|nr:hypothetical protein [Thermoanaerobaculia bacterium]
MTIPLLGLVVLGFLVVAWGMEFRHKEESLPALRQGRHVPAVVLVLVATFLAIPVVIAPLASLTEWPRSTQVAWTGAEAAGRGTGLVAIGGPEHSAILGWPNGNFWPEVSIAPATPGKLRLRTRGGTAIVRAGERYANGELFELGGGPRQLGRFSVEFKRKGILFRPKLIIARTAIGEPLVTIDPPPAHGTRLRVLDSLLVPRLNDLRRGGRFDLATVQALEEWARTMRILRPENGQLRLVADGEAWHELELADGESVEIIWPRRRLGMRVAENGGAPRLTFEAPWTRTTSLPPFDGKASSLSFAREPAIGEHTFLLPLGHGAPEFRHEEALEISAAGLPRFRDGADLLPQPAASSPKFVKRETSLRSTLNRSLSSVRVPLVIPDAAERGLVLTVTMVRDLPTPRALFVALLCAWGALAIFVGSIAYGSAQLRLRDLWCIGGVLVAVWTLLLFRVLLAVRYLVSPSAVDEVTVKGLAGSLASLVIVPGLIALAVRLWLHHRSEPDTRNRIVTIVMAVTFAAVAAIEFTVMPQQVLPNVAARFTSSPFDRLLLVVYAIAALAIARAGAALWQVPYRVTFAAGRAFWRALGDAGRAEARPTYRFLQPVLHVWAALRSPEMRTPFTIWGIGSVLILVASRVAPEYIRQIVAPFWILGLPALLLLARPLTGTEDALRVLDGDAPRVTETPLPDTIATVFLLAFAPVAVMFAVLGDFGAVYAVLAFWLPLALLLLLTSGARMAATLLLAVVVVLAAARWALLGTYAIAPGMTEHILSRVEVMKHGASAQEWLLDLEAPSAGDAKSVTASNVRNALVHEWEHMALVRKGGWTGLGYNHAPASQSYIRQDTIQYDSVYSFFISGEHGILGGLLLLAIFAAPAIVLLMRRSSLHIGDILALAIAAALLGEAAVHAAMNVAQLWFSGRNLPLLATASSSDILRWGLLLGLMAQALLWSSSAPESAVTRRSVFDPAFAYGARRRWKWITATAIIAAGLIAAMATRDFAWLAFAAAIPLAMTLRTREYAALALMPALLVTVLVVRGSIRAVRSDEYDILTWSRFLKRVDELYDAGRLRFDPKTKRILFRAEDGQLTDRPAGATLLEAEVLRFNAMPESLRMDGGRASLSPSFFAGAATPQDYYSRMYRLWQDHTEREQRTRPSVFTIQRTESENELAYEVRGNPDFNVVHTFSQDLREEDLQPIAIRGRKGPVPVLGHAWVMGRWVYAPSTEARRLGLGWLHEAGDSLFRISEERRKRAAQLTIDAELQQAAQSTVEGAGRQLFGNLLTTRASSALPPRVALTIMRATTGEVLAMGAWPRAASGDRWRARNVNDGAQAWRELEPPLSWLGTSAPRALASRQAVDHNFSAIEMGSAAKPFWATAALTVHPSLDRALVIRNGDCDHVANQRCYEQEMFGARISNRGWQVSPVARWVDFSTYLAASDNRYHTRLGMLGLAKAGASGIVSDGRGAAPGGRESLNGSRTPWNRYPALADSTENTREHPNRLARLHQQPLANAMRDLFGAATGAPPAEGETRRHLLSFWSGDQHDDLRTSEGLEPLAVVSPEAVDLRLSGVRSTREFVAILLGGASSRWSNVAAAGAFSSWALRKPVVPHIVARDEAPVALPSRAGAFDERATAAAAKLNGGLRRVLQDGTALTIRGRVASLEQRYDLYAKTGTLVTIDPNRPTSRILIVIVARDEEGNVRNAITLSFVAERSSSGFATALAGQFIARHEAELVRLLESGGR